MTRTLSAVSSTVLVFLACALPASAVAAGATRTWVSGVGEDSNPCSRTAPCKTFAGAIAKTADDGIIDALDPGGYGGVTITQGITLDGTGTLASILVAGTNGVTVDAPGKNVVLNNIEINGAGVPSCSGLNGINLVAAKSLRLTGVTIENFAQNAIKVAPTTGDSTVILQDVDANQGCGAGNGITIAPGGTFSVSAMLDGVTLTNLHTGLSVADRGHAYLSNSTVFNNALGLQTLGSGIIDGLGGNHIVGNGTNGSPTTEISTVGPAGATGPAGAIGPSGQTGSIGKITCKLNKKKKVITCKVSKARKKARITARISRGGQVVAAGHGANTVRLHARRPLTHGTYRLTVVAAGKKEMRNVHL